MQGSGSQMANYYNLITNVYRIEPNGIVTGSNSVLEIFSHMIVNTYLN